MFVCKSRLKKPRKEEKVSDQAEGSLGSGLEGECLFDKKERKRNKETKERENERRDK